MSRARNARAGRALPAFWLLALLGLLAFAPALAAEDVDYLDDSAYETPAETVASIYDPLEPFNRVMFTVNDRLYIWVLDPVASGPENAPLDYYERIMRANLASMADTLGTK